VLVRNILEHVNLKLRQRLRLPQHGCGLCITWLVEAANAWITGIDCAGYSIVTVRGKATGNWDAALAICSAVINLQAPCKEAMMIMRSQNFNVCGYRFDSVLTVQGLLSLQSVSQLSLQAPSRAPLLTKDCTAFVETYNVLNVPSFCTAQTKALVSALTALSKARERRTLMVRMLLPLLLCVSECPAAF
jgi:hypothetical protein